jgi:hypothetical protein
MGVFAERQFTVRRAHRISMQRAPSRDIRGPGQVPHLLIITLPDDGPST